MIKKWLSLILVIALIPLSGCSGDALDFEAGGLTVDGVAVDPVLTAEDITDALTYYPSDNAVAEAKYRLLESRDIDWGWALSYDGNDYLSNGTANFRSADPQGAIEVWFRSSSTANAQTLVSSSDTATTTSRFLLYISQTTGLISVYQQNNADAGFIVTGSINICDGKWHHIVLSSNGTTYSIILDGVSETLIGATNNGDWFGDTTLRDNLTIGAQVHTSIANYAVGDIGFVRIYSRPILAPETLTNYQRGRKATPSDTTGLAFNLNLNEGTGNPVDKVGSLTMTRNGNTKWTGFTAQSPTFSGNVSFTSYGAGSLVTDANGKISVSSDAQLKAILNTLPSGLRQVLNIDPVYFKWREDSGMDTDNTYLGFSAQDVMKYMPEAVGESSNGTLSLSDRALIAYLFAAIKEMQAEIDTLNAANKLPAYNRSMPPDLSGSKTIKSPKPSKEDLLGVTP